MDVVEREERCVLHRDLKLKCWMLTMIACNAQAVDTIVYYNGIIIPGGTYVIESSEELSEDGDRAYQCLLEVFKITLGNNLNCTAV